MPGYRISSLADLARQMEFAPSSVRAAQINAAEDLLHCIDPHKAYPMEFLVFRITGYQPQSKLTGAEGAGEALLPGVALQHDLGRLIEEVSDSLSVTTDGASEPVLGIEDLTEKFNVTSKTIQRWRRRGLPARRFVFPDGKRRVGFLVSSVERFVTLHSDEVRQATNFSQLSETERAGIILRARRLAMTCQCCLHEIARRIGKKINRSHLTVLHTIRKHDADNPEQAIFPLAAQPLIGEDRLRIVRGHRRGMSLAVIARRSCQPKSVVYRVILEERIQRLTSRKQKFIDDPLYHAPNAAEIIDELVRNEELAAPKPGDDRIPRDLPAYFQALYRTPLMTPGRERAMFLKFNFHKYQFVTARRELDLENTRARDVERLEGLLKLATETKNAIVAANLRLVVSVARRHLRPGINLMELVSDGNVTLMRAAESFDFHKGNKFSTYATLALMKGYARSVPLMLSAKKKAGSNGEELPKVADNRTATPTRLAAQDELRGLLDKLEPSERAVLLNNYGVDATQSSALQGVAPTPEEINATLAMSRARLRQIEQRAMAKLRELATLTPPEELESERM